MSQEPSQSAKDVAAFLEELSKNSEVYQTVLNALTERRFGDVVKALPDALKEAKTDYDAGIKAIGDTASSIKSGVATSEFKLSSTLNRILSVIAILAPVMEGILTYMGEDLGGKSFYVTALAILLKTATTISYARGRVELKKS